VIYTILLVPLSLAPTLIGLSGWVYGALSLGLSGWFLLSAIRVWRAGDETRDGDRAAKRLFFVSLVYLFGLFLALAVDKTLIDWVWSGFSV